MCHNCDEANGAEIMDDRTLVESAKGTYIINTGPAYNTIGDVLAGRTRGDRKFQSAVFFFEGEYELSLEVAEEMLFQLYSDASESDDWDLIAKASHAARAYRTEDEARAGHDAIADLVKGDDMPRMTDEEVTIESFDVLDTSDPEHFFSALFSSND